MNCCLNFHHNLICLQLVATTHYYICALWLQTTLSVFPFCMEFPLQIFTNLIFSLIIIAKKQRFVNGIMSVSHYHHQTGNDSNLHRSSVGPLYTDIKKTSTGINNSAIQLLTEIYLNLLRLLLSVCLLRWSFKKKLWPSINRKLSPDEYEDLEMDDQGGLQNEWNRKSFQLNESWIIKWLYDSQSYT